MLAEIRHLREICLIQLHELLLRLEALSLSLA
jgi:hypothetical protein